MGREKKRKEENMGRSLVTEKVPNFQVPMSYLKL